MIDSVNDYAREWLNISSTLRSFLLQNSTEDNLKAIRQVVSKINPFPNIGNFSQH